MSFLIDYPVFSAGCFFDREGRIKARIDNDKYTVRKTYDGKVIGYIKNGKLYDETLNYVGYFKNGILYSFGGNIIGYCNGWVPEESKKSLEESSLWSIVLLGAVVIGCFILYLNIASIFF